MLDKLFRSFDVILRQKHSLSTKANQLAESERQLVQKLSQALSSAGYRVVPLAGPGSGSGRSARRSGAPKTLRCPHCERMFAHPLPMARHIKATHHAKAVKAAKKKGGKKSA